MAKKTTKKTTKKKTKALKKKYITRTAILVISVVLALLSFVSLPYLLAQIIRLLSFVGFLILAFLACKDKQWFGVAIYLGVGMLCQPVPSFMGGEMVRNIIDILLVIIIGYALYKGIYPKIKSKPTKTD